MALVRQPRTRLFTQRSPILLVRHTGWSACRDFVYISLICPVPFILQEFCLDVFRPVPLCQDDIMLTLQIVPGVETFSCKAG